MWVSSWEAWGGVTQCDSQRLGQLQAVEQLEQIPATEK